MKFWVDPASGWRHGFPKLWDPNKDGPLEQWLFDQGLPLDLISLDVRMWEENSSSHIHE